MEKKETGAGQADVSESAIKEVKITNPQTVEITKTGEAAEVITASKAAVRRKKGKEDKNEQWNTDKDLQYIRKEIESALKLIEKYNESTDESGAVSVPEFEKILQRIIDTFETGKSTHDLPLDFRFRHRLELIEQRLKIVWNGRWPGEKKRPTGSNIAQRVRKLIKGNAEQSFGYDAQVKEPEKNVLRHAFGHLIDQVHGARLHGTAERIRGIAYGITVSVGAILGTAAFDYFHETEQEIRAEVLLAADRLENFEIIEVSDRRLTVVLPRVDPSFGMEYRVYMSNPGDAHSFEAVFNPATKTAIVPPNVQPRGGSVEVYIQVLMQPNGTSHLTKRKLARGIAPVKSR